MDGSKKKLITVFHFDLPKILLKNIIIINNSNNEYH